MPKRRVYIIGVGSIANSRIQTIGKLPIDELETHVSDNNPIVLQQFKERFSSVIPHQDTLSMLAEPAWENDIVIVCTPPVSHCSVTLQALESKRHVLCEKPLAMNQEESRSMLAKAREVEKLLGCRNESLVACIMSDGFTEGKVRDPVLLLGPIELGVSIVSRVVVVF